MNASSAFGLTSVLSRYKGPLIASALAMSWILLFPLWEARMASPPLDVPISLNPPGAIEQKIRIVNPEQYVLRLKFNRTASIDQPSSDKDEVNFGIELMLPNYEPRMVENHAVFERAFDRKLLVQVINHSKNLTGKKLFDQFYKNVNSKKTDGVFDFKGFQWVPGYIGVFHGTPENPLDFAMCNVAETNLHNSCQKIILIAPQMTMSYYFPYDELPHMNDITNKLVSILNSYRVDGPELSVLQ